MYIGVFARIYCISLPGNEVRLRCLSPARLCAGVMWYIHRIRAIRAAALTPGSGALCVHPSERRVR
jgi:hypothetical protein